MNPRAALAAALLLAACGPIIPRVEPPAQPTPVPTATPTPPTALLMGVRAGPSIGSLDLAQADAGPALASFVESCPRLVAREELTALLPDALGRRVLAALEVLADGGGPVELENGHRVDSGAG